MRDWVLVIGSMHAKSPTADEVSKALKSKTFKHRAQAASRLVLLDRDQLCRLFGPTFVERARLFLDPPVDAAPAKPKPKPKPKPKLTSTRTSASTSKSKATRGDAALGDGEQRAL